MMSICFYRLLKIRNIWCLMKRVKKCILGVCFIRIIPNIKIKNEERILGIEIQNGKMPISIHLLIYRIICCGD